MVDMKSVAAALAKLNFGQLLDAAQREPVTITKKDRPVAVILSTQPLLIFQVRTW